MHSSFDLYYDPKEFLEKAFDREVDLGLESSMRSFIKSKIESEVIYAMLNSAVDISVLQELKKASSLIEAPNIDKKPDIEKLTKMLTDTQDLQERNSKIVKAYEQGYSQHMIAKVLDISQPAVHGVIKRSSQ